MDDGLSGNERLEHILRLTEAAMKAAESEMQGRGGANWRPLPHQVAPPGDWLGWCLLGGRGSGKTAACAKYFVDHVHGPPCLTGDTPHWMAIVAPTLGDAATSCYAGPSGIHQLDPTAVLQSKVGGLVVTWPNGSQAKMYGAREPDDVERLRAGGNTCLAWLEELAAWRYLQEAYDQMIFGLRLGRRPKWIASTTPKPRPLIKKIAKGLMKNVASTHATTDDNPYLPEHIRDALHETYGGTAVGAQELLGKIVEQDENALWTRDKIAENRLDDVPEKIQKIEVGVDPSGGAGEQGIVVVGGLRELIRVEGKDSKPSTTKIERRGYTLADFSGKFSPDGWGRASVQAAIEWEADCIVVETNFGGAMAVATINTAAEKMGISIPVKTVTASRGKAPRAQPVAAMSAQDRWHFVGHHDQLEDQCCTWTVDAGYSPDRMDAMVWPAWHMRLVSTVSRSVGTFGGGTMSRRKIG